MKKVITILIIICIMLCGCSKSEPQTTPTTAPTSEPTKEPTQAPTVPTEKSNESGLTIICEFCNESPAEYVYKDHALCYEDYMLALRNETDIQNYNAIIESANIAGTYEDVITELASMGPAQIYIDQSGVQLKNSGANLLIALESCIPDLMDITIAQKCEIQVEFVAGVGVKVTKTKPPIYWIDAIGK